MAVLLNCDSITTRIMKIQNGNKIKTTTQYNQGSHNRMNIFDDHLNNRSIIDRSRSRGRRNATFAFTEAVSKVRSSAE